MKKIIKILQSNAEHLIIEDEDDSDLNEYILNLSNILSVGNVVILETSSSSVILRPNQISSIVVTEEGIKTKRKYTKKEKKVEDIITEDIITDE